MMTDQAVPPRAKETAQRFNVRDGHRPLTFVGWLVARADSQSGTDVRWTELSMYVTLGGKYLIEKIGRSDVFHTENCARRSKGKVHNSLTDAMPDDLEPGDTIKTVFVPCDECQPDHNVTPAWVERDIYSIAVHNSAREAIDSLHRREGDVVRPLSRVARALLDEAEKTDGGIQTALNSPADIT